MGLATGGFTTRQAVGNREDLTDVIYDISPTETPFMTAIGRTDATAVRHDWQTDTLADVDKNNARVEGNEIAGSTSAPTVRAENLCQISTKDVVITRTQDKVKKAGRKSETAYQIAKRGKELKRDMEAILTSEQGERAASDDATARKLRGFESWIQTNTNRASNGANATAATASPTDGTQRDFTEAMLKEVLSNCWDAGAEPTMVLLSSGNKMRASTFTGRTNSRVDVNKNTIQAAASLYASDFGDVKLVPSRFHRARSALVVDPEYAAVAWLDGIKVEDLAKTGDSTKKFLVGEYTLEMKNEKAHGIIADLTTTIPS